MNIVVRCSCCGRDCNEAKVYVSDNRKDYREPLATVHITFPPGWVMEEDERTRVLSVNCPRCSREQRVEERDALKAEIQQKG